MHLVFQDVQSTTMLVRITFCGIQVLADQLVDSPLIILIVIFKMCGTEELTCLELSEFPFVPIQDLLKVVTATTRPSCLPNGLGNQRRVITVRQGFRLHRVTQIEPVPS